MVNAVMMNKIVIFPIQLGLVSGFHFFQLRLFLLKVTPLHNNFVKKHPLYTDARALFYRRSAHYWT